MSAASLDGQPKLSVVVPAASDGGDSLGKSPRPQVPPDGKEDEGILVKCFSCHYTILYIVTWLTFKCIYTMSNLIACSVQYLFLRTSII